MDDASLAIGTIVANNYRVTTPLGAGGMGTVYLAENLTLKQRVVVKLLRGAQVGAGHEEAQLLAAMQHPNVVTVYAHDPARDLIVMEFLDGTGLSALLERGIDRVNAIRVGLAVAEALAAVHKRGLVHRDIKPDNVMLALNSGGGRLVDWLKLIDFGTALKVGKAPPAPIGTPEFCPPEQFQAGTPAQPGNDVYALGVTLYLLLTGKFPYEGDPASLYRQHLSAPLPALVETLVELHGDAAFDPRTRALLEDLDDLLKRMMAKRLEERPTASDVARTLTRLESSFADAGTYVGSMQASTATFRSLEPVRQRELVASGRHGPVPAVVAEADTAARPAFDPRPRRSTAGTAAPAPERPPSPTSTTQPDALPARSSPRAPSGDAPRVVSRPPTPHEVRTATPGGDDGDVARSRLPTAHEVRATVTDDDSAASSSRLPTAHEVRATSTDDDAAPASTRTLQLVLGAVVLLLALALGAQVLLSKPDTSQPTPPAAPVARPTPEPEPTPEPTPPPPPEPVAALDAGQVTNVTPPPEPAPLDAGVVATPTAPLTPPDEPTPLPPTTPHPKTPKTPKGKLPKGAACTFTDESRAKYLGEYDALRSKGTAAQKAAIEDLEDLLSQAIKDRDCQAAQGVLRRMSAKLKK